MERGPGEWQPDAGDELIEAYLDELLLALRGRPRDARRLLAEAEGHLRESVAAGAAAWLGRAAAAEEAIRRFGPPSAALGCGAVLAQRVTGWPRLRRSPAR